MPRQAPNLRHLEGSIEDVNVVFCNRLDVALLILPQMLRREFINRIVQKKQLIASFQVLLEGEWIEDGVLGVVREVQGGALVKLNSEDVNAVRG